MKLPSTGILAPRLFRELLWRPKTETDRAQRRAGSHGHKQAHYLAPSIKTRNAR